MARKRLVNLGESEPCPMPLLPLHMFPSANKTTLARLVHDHLGAQHLSVAMFIPQYPNAKRYPLNQVVSLHQANRPCDRYATAETTFQRLQPVHSHVVQSKNSNGWYFLAFIVA